MKAPIRRRTKEERKEKLEEWEKEAQIGMTYGFELVDKWATRLRAKWIVRGLLALLVIWIIYWLITNGGI